MLACFITVSMSAASPQTRRDRNSLQMPDGSSSSAIQNGAESPSFSDASWRTVDLPHDWSIESKPDKDNPSGAGGGFFPAGMGWYRKTFHAPADWKGKRVSVEFDGVYRDATVYLNGHKLGTHPYGYTASPSTSHRN